MPKKKYRTHGISFPDETLLAAAKAKAAAEDRTLSNYICRLLREDLSAMREFPTAQTQPEAKPVSYKKPRL